MNRDGGGRPEDDGQDWPMGGVHGRGSNSGTTDAANGGATPGVTGAANGGATPGATDAANGGATPGATPGATDAANGGAIPGVTDAANGGATPGVTDAANGGAIPGVTGGWNPRPNNLEDFQKLRKLGMSAVEEQNLWEQIEWELEQADKGSEAVDKGQREGYKGSEMVDEGQREGYKGPEAVDKGQGTNSKGSGAGKTYGSGGGPRRWLPGAAAAAAVVVAAGVIGTLWHGGMGPFGLAPGAGNRGAVDHPAGSTSSTGNQRSTSAGTIPSSWHAVGGTYLVQGQVYSMDINTLFHKNNHPYQQLVSISFMPQAVVATAGDSSAQPGQPFALNSLQTIRVDAPLSAEGSLNLQNYDSVEIQVTEYADNSSKRFWGTDFSRVYEEQKDKQFVDWRGQPFVASSQYWFAENPNLLNVTVKSVKSDSIIGQVPDYQTQGLKPITVPLNNATKIWDNGQLVPLAQAPTLKSGSQVYIITGKSGEVSTGKAPTGGTSNGATSTEGKSAGATSTEGKSAGATSTEGKSAGATSTGGVSTGGTSTGGTLPAAIVYGPAQQVIGRVLSDQNNILTLQEVRYTAGGSGIAQTVPVGKTTVKVQYNSKTYFEDGSSMVNVGIGDVVRCQVTGFTPGLLLAQGISVDSSAGLSAPYTIGSLSLGEAMAQVQAQLGTPEIKTTAHGEGGPQWNYQSKGILIDGDPVWNITVTAPFSGSTVKGIHIGSTSAQVKKAYPTATLHTLGGGETSYIISSPDKQVELLIQCDKNGKVYLINLQSQNLTVVRQ